MQGNAATVPPGEIDENAKPDAEMLTDVFTVKDGGNTFVIV